MKSMHMAATVLMLSVSLAGIRLADAREGAVDWHGAICQPAQPSATVQYDAAGVHTGASGATVICPLQGFAGLPPDKDGQWKVEIEAYTSGSISCTFTSTSDGSNDVSFPFTNSGTGTYSSGPLGPVDEPVMPDLGGMPVQVSLSCNMGANSTIGSIRLENVRDVSPPSSGAPLASQTP